MLMDAAIAILLIVYLMIAAFALYMTYDEQCKSNNNNPFYNIMSFFACMLWPVTLLTVTVAARRQA